MFKEVRELLLEKCKPSKRTQIRAIFEKEAFGELERLVTQKLLDVLKVLVREELGRENWLRIVARESNRSYKQMRVAVLEFLDADVFNITPEACMAFFDPLIVSWDIDLASFSLEIFLNRKIAPGSVKRFEFTETEAGATSVQEPGLRAFLKNRSLSADATPEEIEFLKQLRFKGRSPTDGALLLSRVAKPPRSASFPSKEVVHKLDDYQETFGYTNCWVATS